MGNEVSKQEVVEPPPEWDPVSNAKKFELVSPMSDLSDPSMFLHRRPQTRLSDVTVQQIMQQQKHARTPKEPPAKFAGGLEPKATPVATRQTPAGDRRRKSKVIATRDSAYKHQPRQRELPAPSSFYFPTVPTKETEENLNRMSIRKLSNQGETTARKSSNKNSNVQTQHNKENRENNIQAPSKSTPLLTKAKRQVSKAKTCLAGCFEESNHRLREMQDNFNHQQRRKRLSTSDVEIENEQAVAQKTSSNVFIHDEPFDPYKEDSIKAKSRVLQLVDGQEQELAFNPVWRESTDGTLLAGAGRESNLSSTVVSEQRCASDVVKVRDSSAPRELSRIRSESSGREYNDRVDSESDMLDTTAEPVESKGRVSSLINMYDRRLSADVKNDKQRRSSTGMTQPCYNTSKRESISSNRESISSHTASHESSYWNNFYKDAQVLHHEDAYFDRITYKDPSSSHEASPMAETPVMKLFGKAKSESLLGPTNTSIVSEEDFPENSISEKPELSTTRRLSSCSRKDILLNDDAENETDIDQRTLPVLKERFSRDEPPIAENEVTESQTSSRVLHKYHDTSDKNEDVTTKKSESSVQDDELKNTKSSDAAEVDRSNHDSLHEEKVNSFSMGGMASSLSHINNRITASEVLVQTQEFRSIPRPAPPKPADKLIEPSCHDTPIGPSIETHTSFGSAFSYKDKDVFTPLSSSQTYPKGSPFRPRLDIPKLTMAKVNPNRNTMVTQSFDNVSCTSSRYAEIKATESAPSMIETQDYRDIALGYLPDSASKGTANEHEPTLSVESPSLFSLDSSMSISLSPRQALLSDQAVSNAAFLFSPSYAKGHSKLTVPQKETQREYQDNMVTKSKHSSTFSISTLGSRSRLSVTQNSVQIPASSSATIVSKAASEKEKSIGNSASSTTATEKSVRFSDGLSIAPSEAEEHSQKSRRSVRWDFSLKEAPSDVNIPAIETKVSDLSDTVFGNDSLEQANKKRQIVDSPLSSLHEAAIEETETASLTASSASRPSTSSSRHSMDISIGPTKISSTPEKETRTWKYCELSKGVTPMLDKKQLSNATTNSPVVRFKAAKNKFVGRQDKVVPVKKGSPGIKAKKTGKVHLLASKFDNPGSPLVPRTTCSGHNLKSTKAAEQFSTILPGRASFPDENRRMLRTPQILGYTAKAYPSIFQGASFERRASSIGEVRGVTTSAEQTLDISRSIPVLSKRVVAEIPRLSTTATVRSFDAIPDDESEDCSRHSFESDDSTYVQSVATVRQEGRQPHQIESKNENLTCLTRKIEEEDMPCDEAEDDFAEVLLDNLLGEHISESRKMSVTADLGQSHSQKIQIMVSSDEDDDSTFSNILSAPTFSDESTTMSAILAQQTTANLRHGEQTVKPHVQKHHVPHSQSLHLSPIQRTPMQASKWRELADKAQKLDSKKNIFRSGKKSKKLSKAKAGLSERDTNIV